MTKSVYINAATAICPNGTMGSGGMLHAIEPDYKQIITNANLRRRMSHIVKMGVACGLLCIERNENKPIDAIITATGLGCLADTEKFLSAIINNNEQLLNPTAFTQSTFNVIGAQIALLTKNKSYNNTYVHRGLSFETALIDGMMRINEGDKNVLAGAIDEATLLSNSIMQRMGLLKGITMGEGAQFFVLSNSCNGDANIELKAVKTLSGKLDAGVVIQHIQNFLGDNNLESSSIDLMISGANGNTEKDKIYAGVSAKLFPDTLMQTFKNECGEYATSSSYALYKAFNYMQNNKAAKNVLIYNCYNNINHSLILAGR